MADTLQPLRIPVISRPSFLVVEDQPDNRALLINALMRKFPGSRLTTCDASAAVMKAVQASTLTAVIVHRASDADGLPRLEMLRTADSALPLILISSANNRTGAFEAGASAYLTYDSWVRIGAVVEDVLRTGSAAPILPAKSA